MYEPRLSFGKDGFALTIYSYPALGVVLRGIFWPFSWLAKFTPWRVSNFLIKPFTWSLLDGHQRLSIPLTPYDALTVCWAMDFDDRDIEFFWAMSTSILWEDARDEGNDDLAMTLKGLLATQGYNEEGEPVHA